MMMKKCILTVNCFTKGRDVMENLHYNYYYISDNSTSIIRCSNDSSGMMELMMMKK